MKMRAMHALRLLMAALWAMPCSSGLADEGASGSVERGRYLVTIGNCVGCHTARFIALDGKVPEDTWFTGSAVGFRSQIGTTYASNLRLYFQELSEDGWLAVARTVTYRRPMPWWSLRVMTDDDLLAVYRYVRSLGPKGDRAPAFLPPGQEPPRPYIELPTAPSP
jgi:mono/diheme cytochrome c family protein